MTLRQAAKKAKNELQNEAVTTIKKQTLFTYNICIAHRIADLVGGSCDEVEEGKKIRYIIKQPSRRKK
jgi:hypothetical protein